MPSTPTTGLEPLTLLAARAAATPESPFLFARAPGGHFDWWSWRRSAEEPSTGRSDDVRSRFLHGLIASAETIQPALVDRLADAASLPDGRPIWLTRGQLVPGEPAIAAAAGLAALVGGWAVVVEPGERLHPETFLWVRPTLVVEGSASLRELVDGVAALAPRWRRERWLRRRLARLRLVVTSETDRQGELKDLWRRIGSTARVLCIPPSGW